MAKRSKFKIGDEVIYVRHGLELKVEKDGKRLILAFPDGDFFAYLAETPENELKLAGGING